jgi:hypothetical protein
MSKLGKWGVTALTMVAVATVVLLVTGWGSAVAASGASFFVNNTASDPVPVHATGTVPVHEQGTANVDVTNTTALPVQETNTDAQGDVKVHEQGTADVNVTNTTVPVQEQGTVQVASSPVTDGGGMASGTPHAGSFITFNPSITASAISVSFDSTISDIVFGTNQGGVDLVKTGAVFLGPADGGPDNLNFAFTTPITFNEFICEGTAGVCRVSWTGGSS